jgi:hypothetical protein
MTTKNVDITAVLERLELDNDFKEFCKFLDDTFTAQLKQKILDSEKITAEDYAKGKIFCNLATRPRALLNQLITKEKKPKNVYE